jgi:hypothetical protein
MTNSIEIIVRGQKIKFHPKGNKNGHYYEMPNGNGFYMRENFKVWGRPNKKNAVEIATFYIESMPSRITTFDSYNKLAN